MDRTMNRGLTSGDCGGQKVIPTASQSRSSAHHSDLITLEISESPEKRLTKLLVRVSFSRSQLVALTRDLTLNPSSRVLLPVGKCLIPCSVLCKRREQDSPYPLLL